MMFQIVHVHARKKKINSMLELHIDSDISCTNLTCIKVKFVVSYFKLKKSLSFLFFSLS